MASCTFFGHKDTHQKIESTLRSTLIDLINNGVNIFYVGNQGSFDAIAASVLADLKIIFPHINYYIVLAYLPTKSDNHNLRNYDVTIYPEGLERVPPKYAIIKRNVWMIDHADYVVTHVRNSIGNAHTFKTMAEKKGKIVISI